MKVTSVISQEKNKECFNIYVDGSYCFSADMDMVNNHNISEGLELSQEELDNIIIKSTFKKAFNYALYVLAKSDKTEHEIINKLRVKQYPDTTIEKVLNQLKELNYLNDESYVDKWIRSNITRSNINKKIIFNKLMLKGINRNLIEKVIEKSTIDGYSLDEFSIAMNLAKKKIQALKEQAGKKEKNFLTSCIQKVTNQMYVIKSLMK